LLGIDRQIGKIERKGPFQVLGGVSLKPLPQDFDRVPNPGVLSGTITIPPETGTGSNGGLK
jgi:hypothetical protein